jgi:hypothetical protein
MDEWQAGISKLNSHTSDFWWSIAQQVRQLGRSCRRACYANVL